MLGSDHLESNRTLFMFTIRIPVILCKFDKGHQVTKYLGPVPIIYFPAETVLQIHFSWFRVILFSGNA